MFRVVFCSEYRNILATATKPLYSGRKVEASCSNIVSTWWSVFCSWVEMRSLSVCSLTHQNLYSGRKVEIERQHWELLKQNTRNLTLDAHFKDGAVRLLFYSYVDTDRYFCVFSCCQRSKLQHTTVYIFKGVPGKKCSNFCCFILISI